MAAGNITNLSELLNYVVPDGVHSAMYKRSRFLSKIKKDTSWKGSTKEIVMMYAPTAGGSAQFGYAQQNKDPSINERFSLTQRDEYSLASLTGKFLHNCQGDKQAVMDGFKSQFDAANYTFARAMAVNAWGAGGGALGRIDPASAVATTTITLTNASDCVKFEKGMWVELSTDQGVVAPLAGVKGAPTQIQIDRVDRDNGLVIAAVPWNTIAGAAVNDYIFRAGDYSVKMSGVEGWIPSVAPAPGDNWYGVDRSDDPTRLGGQRINGLGAPKEEVLIDASARCFREGGEPDFCYMNPVDFAALSKELGAKRQYNDTKSDDASISFRGILVDGASGPFTCLAEPNVPEGRAYLLTMDTWGLYTSGGCPMLLNLDQAGKLRIEGNADAYEFRLGCYGNIACVAPGHNCNITW